jgi:hypothetical protein
MSEFTKLITLEDWAEKLDELLSEAEAATGQRDDTKRLKLGARLRAFASESPASLEGTSSLDKVALDAASSLAAAIMDESLARINERTAEFAALRKTAEAAANTTIKHAREARFTRAQEVLRSLTDAATVLRDFDDTFRDADDPTFRKKVADALKVLESTRKTLADITRDGQ